MRIHYTEAHLLGDVCWYGLINQFNVSLATTLEEVWSTFADPALAQPGLTAGKHGHETATTL